MACEEANKKPVLPTEEIRKLLQSTKYVNTSECILINAYYEFVGNPLRALIDFCVDQGSALKDMSVFTPCERVPCLSPLRISLRWRNGSKDATNKSMAWERGLNFFPWQVVLRSLSHKSLPRYRPRSTWGGFLASKNPDLITTKGKRYKTTTAVSMFILRFPKKRFETKSNCVSTECVFRIHGFHARRLC